MKNIQLPKTLNEMSEFVVDNIEKIQPIVSPKLDFQQFAASVVVACNQLTKKCNVSSVLIAAFNAAHIGLMPGSHLGLCYFIPRKGRCCLDIGYRGFLELAYENKFLNSIYADVVLQGEEFEVWTDEKGPRMLHKPNMERDLSNKNCRNHVTYAYCVYQTVTGGSSYSYVTRKDLDKIDTNRNVWLSNYYAMCRKSPIRRAAKDWRLTDRLAHAIELDEINERKEEQPIIPALGFMIDEGTEPLDFNQFKDVDVIDSTSSPHVEVK